MTGLILSDLHEIFDQINDIYAHYDFVVISGDIFEFYEKEPYKILAKIFNDKPVICCLGNHEFAYRSVSDTLKFYSDKYDPTRYNVHYLDVIGKYQINNLNFIGNVLWYDGSMSTVPEQDVTNISKTWLDSSILCFNPIIESQKCIRQIESNLSSDKKNILITHTVPDKELNLHMSKKTSIYNAYSGVDGLLYRYNFDYSFSGHTHRKISKIINNCNCINVGSDYCREKFRYQIVEF